MKKTTIVHIALLSAIVIVIAVAVIMLLKWNQGVDLDHEADIEQIDPSEFDIETMDMLIPLDSSRLAGHEDDGELQILCLGNNPFTDDRSETGLASLIAKKTGAKVYDGAFPDSSAAFKHYPIDVNYPLDHFSLPSIANALMASNFKTLHSACQYMNDPSAYQPGIDALEAVDMNRIDAIVIMYDSTDYNKGTPCINEEVPEDVQAFTGGITFFLNIVAAQWPHIRCFVMTPTYAQYMDENGKLFSGTVKDIGNGALPYYVQNEVSAVVGCGCSIIDNYYGTINESNYEEYMTDHMHYNDAGREKIADRISEIINNNMGTVSSTSENAND